MGDMLHSNTVKEHGIPLGETSFFFPISLSTRNSVLLGTGIFFIGYLAQLPANMVCVVVGARRWLACILVAWGFVAMCFATVRRVWQFLLLRFLLGGAEAGAYPGRKL